ncbi:MAG TPA: DUF5686 family protein [Puia sp.]|nr:DUF5686 family protein [Puia sp.]
MLIAGLLWKTGVGQTRTIVGTVLDSSSHQPIAGASVIVANGHHGVLTDSKGQFHLSIENGVRRLVVSATGYRSGTVPIKAQDGQPLVILLPKNFTLLQDVVVKSKPGKYRNRNNPAVELIRKVIAHKPGNAPGANAYESFTEYEKTRLLLDKVPHFIADNSLLKKYHFIFENTDTTILPGRTLIPFYIEEVSSQNYRRSHPGADKKIVLGRKSVDFGEYLDMKGISVTINRLYEDVDIYDNTIEAFTMQFISPIADLGPTFYMYFIRDTIEDRGEKLVELYYTPRNPEDLLFRGTLYITLDGHFAVRKAELGVSQHINLNYAREFRISLDFEKDSAGRYHLATSDMLALLSPFPNSFGMVGERMVSISRYATDSLPDRLFNGPAIDSSALAARPKDSLLFAARPVPLSVTEARTYANTDSLVRMRSYHRLMDYATAFTAGYKSVGKFDVGPIGSFWTFDPVEGQRLKFGGRTSTRLSTSWFGESYVAYGFRDQRWKYFLSASYALNHKSIYTYPLHFIQVSWLDDARPLGQENAFAIANNFFTSFSHGDNSKWLYNRILRATYIREFPNHLSWSVGMKYWRQAPAGSLYYIYKDQVDQADTLRRMTTGEFSATLRWAPHEQFLQNKNGRFNIVNRYPIVTLQYGKGIEGLFGGMFNYEALHLRIYKRCYIAPAGYSDVQFDAGWLGGNLPFPLLVIHPGNPSYFYSQGAYNLMNVGEFVSDHYAGLNIDHFFNGFFFNKVPGLKRLRLREVVAGKILYGGLRDENNPAVDPAQMKFPVTNGLTSTYALGARPYIEGSVGIYNIFTVFRVDLVKRFTYLDHPGASGLGVRVSSNFSF